ncbi:MAG TPA: DUF2964 family protein [Trinickia sp.]|jgi:hypothetical protein|uniref:DUF2964 family protein n=1 Tax=Trinickia sp. TaxID=2571163 RepID=UPI002C65E04B|nr:DUF2964 family protein [Trinickia sp.]HTI19265.1 DUF2964 family protein [Trinickia sp.]
MRKSETRIAIALFGAVIWLGGLYAAVLGLIYDHQTEFGYGVFGVSVGVAILVIALNRSDSS